MAVSPFTMPPFCVFRFSMHVRAVTLAETLDPMKKWEIRLMVWRGDFHLVIPRRSHFGYENFGYWWWYSRLRFLPRLGTKGDKKESGSNTSCFGFSGQPQLWWTILIHHLEPSDPRLGERSTTAAVLPDPLILKASEELAAVDFVDYLGYT